MKTQQTNGLSRQQIQEYEDKGALVVRDLLAPDELAMLQRATDELLDQARSIDGKNPLFEFSPEHSRDRPLVKKIKKRALDAAPFEAIRTHPRLLDAVGSIIGDSFLCARKKINVKLPGQGENFPWHQDWAYHPYTNDAVLHVGVAIDAMDADNGGVFVVPGSHRGPLFDHRDASGLFVGAVDPSAVPIERAQPLEVPAGGMCMFHTRTLHSSQDNLSDRPRRLLLLEYVAADAWPLMGITSWENYAGAFVRGEPTAEPRWTNVPIRIPLPGLRGSLQKI